MRCNDEDARRRLKMKLSISNIGWSEKDDQQVYAIMKKIGFSGLEIAPTRIFPEKPYEDLVGAKNWSKNIVKMHNFKFPSMQSIWYGKSESIWGSNEECNILLEYSKRAIDFAETIGCKTLVFGCPRNRFIPKGIRADESITFFREIGEYAVTRDCVIAMEAIPAIYNTNFLNTTEEALEFIKKVNSKGLMLNLDAGTMVENGESVYMLKGNEQYIRHVHISEPGLKPIQKRELHLELATWLKSMNYNGFVSIEVGRQDSVESLLKMMEYVKGIFG